MEGDDQEQQQHRNQQHSLLVHQRELEELKRERRHFLQFLRSEGGKDLVAKYKEWCIVQTLRADEESVFSLFSPELIVLIFSHLDECSLATVCKTWKLITDMHEDYLWKRLAHKFFTFCPGSPREELSQQAALKREKDSAETWKQFFRRALGRHPRLDFHPTPAGGLYFPMPVHLVHTQLYMRNSTRSSVIFFRVMVTKPKDYVVKPTHGILLPRQILRVAIVARQLAKETLEQVKECRDKFMIQTTTVSLEQLVEEGAVEPKRADPSYVRKARSCTLDLSHIFADNFDALRYVKDNPDKVSKHIFKCHYLPAAHHQEDDQTSAYSAAS